MALKCESPMVLATDGTRLNQACVQPWEWLPALGQELDAEFTGGNELDMGWAPGWISIGVKVLGEEDVTAAVTAYRLSPNRPPLYGRDGQLNQTAWAAMLAMVWHDTATGKGYVAYSRTPPGSSTGQSILMRLKAALQRRGFIEQAQPPAHFRYVAPPVKNAFGGQFTPRF